MIISPSNAALEKIFTLSPIFGADLPDLPPMTTPGEIKQFVPITAVWWITTPDPPYAMRVCFPILHLESMCRPKNNLPKSVMSLGSAGTLHL
jgi:hypothetical protein